MGIALMIVESKRSSRNVDSSREVTEVCAKYEYIQMTTEEQ